MTKILKIFMFFGVTFLSSIAAPEDLLDSLWKTLKFEQVRGMGEGLSGGWPEEIVLKGQLQPVVTDLSPFSALQIMLRLEAIKSKIPFPDYLGVKEQFKPFVDYYLNHRLENEPYGSIGFWPVWKLNDKEFIRSPSTDPIVRKITGDHLPADSDCSSQMAIWLHHTEPMHPFINAYLAVLENILDENRTSQTKRETLWKNVNSGAFLTWIGVPAFENNVDCLVNINILTSLSMIKKSLALSEKLQQAEKNSSELIFNVLNKSQFPKCSYYYARWSQFYLALGKLYEVGGGVFTSRQWDMIRSHFKAALLKSWNARHLQATNEWAEFFVTARLLGLLGDVEINPTLIKIRNYLLSQVQNKTYDALIEGNDVFRGELKPGMTFLWFVKAQTATFLLEALQ